MKGTVRKKLPCNELHTTYKFAVSNFCKDFRVGCKWLPNVICLFVCLMLFNATFNNISVLLLEETGGPGENHRPVASH